MISTAIILIMVGCVASFQPRIIDVLPPNPNKFTYHHHPPRRDFSIWPDRSPSSGSHPYKFDPSKLRPKFLPCKINVNDCNITNEYRTMDGTCNNIHHYIYGASSQPLSRILPAVYDEGVMRMRSISGKYLSNPRLISLKLQNLPPRKPTQPLNLFFLIFGQFIDHDMINVPTVQRADCKGCSSGTKSECAPIPVPHNDPLLPSIHPSGKAHCISFTRSSAIPTNKKEHKGFLSQINFNTAFLDLSTVYGSDNCKAKTLRLYSGGQLEIVSHPTMHHGMPPSQPAFIFKHCATKFEKCCDAGDERSNEHLPLLLIHIIFLSEHNRLAKGLQEINPHWSDEKLFQEARKINIAQYQQIIYNNFLPAMIGQSEMQKYNLNIKQNGYNNNYSPLINPQILNEFSTAAFRVGHTMVPDHFHLFDANYKPLKSIPLIEMFNDPSHFMHKIDIQDELLRGLLGTAIKPVDGSISSSLVNQLFINGTDHFSSLDLVAINIARGRDHGLPSYVNYRKACDLTPVRSWEDLNSLFSTQEVNILKSVYESPFDIDIFVGGIMERPEDGALIGETFACIIAYQFSLLKNGDRFWHNNPREFTLSQINALRKNDPLYSIVNTFFEQTTMITEDLMRIPNVYHNKFQQRNFSAKLDLSPWKETSPPPQPKDCVYKGSIYPPGVINLSACLDCSCVDTGYVKCTEKPLDCSTLQETLNHFDEFCYKVCTKSINF